MGHGGKIWGPSRNKLQSRLREAQVAGRNLIKRVQESRMTCLVTANQKTSFVTNPGLTSDRLTNSRRKLSHDRTAQSAHLLFRMSRGNVVSRSKPRSLRSRLTIFCCSDRFSFGFSENVTTQPGFGWTNSLRRWRTAFADR